MPRSGGAEKPVFLSGMRVAGCRLLPGTNVPGVRDVDVVSQQPVVVPVCVRDVLPPALLLLQDAALLLLLLLLLLQQLLKLLFHNNFVDRFPPLW